MQTHPGWRTTTIVSFLDMIELEPGAIFLVYDRIPGGWKGVLRDSPEWNEIYAVRIMVSRAAQVESEETR